MSANDTVNKFANINKRKHDFTFQIINIFNLNVGIMFVTQPMKHIVIDISIVV